MDDCEPITLSFLPNDLCRINEVVEPTEYRLFNDKVVNMLECNGEFHMY